MKKESFIYSTLTIGGSKEQVNEVMKYICDDIYDIGSIDLNKICAVPVHLNIGPDDEVSCGEKIMMPVRMTNSPPVSISLQKRKKKIFLLFLAVQISAGSFWEKWLC